MALPLIGALAGLGRVAGAAAVGPTARVGYGAALGGLAKDAVVGAGKGFVGGLKGAMMTEAPGLTGAYAFGKELRNRANASRGNASPPSPTNKSSSNTPVIGGLGSLNTTSIVVGQKQSNIINLEQVRQLKQLNDSVINQSKLIAYQIDDTRRKNQFAEEAANEQAIRDDKLLEAIRNIGGLGKNGKGPAAANDSSGGGFLSSLLGSLAGSAGVSAISKLVPLLSGAMAALPWARILRLATPVGTALSLGGSTPNKDTQQKQNKFSEDRAIKQAQERAAEEAKDAPRPLDGSRGNYRNNQRIWDEKYQGRKDPVTGKTIPGIYNIPVSGEVTSTTGTRKTKTPGMSTNHQGIDIAAVLGSPVNSIAPGTVIEVDKEGGVPDANGHKKGLGRFVTIDHGQGVISKYGHLSVVSVNKGDKVGPGVLLGKSGGNTEDPGSGPTTGPHLHLETTNFGKFIDPASLPGLVALGQVKNVVQLGAAAGLPPAVTSPAAGNSPAQSSSPTGGKKSNIISSTANSNAGPLAEYYKENNAKIGAIKTNSAVKNGILKSLSGKSLEQLAVLRKQVENITLDPSDKTEVLSAIDEEIKKKTVIAPKTSSSAYDQILAAFSAPFDKSKYDAGVQYASLDTGIRSDAGGGGGSNFEVKKEVVQTNDAETQKSLAVIADGLGMSITTGQAKVTGAGYQGNPLLTKAFKPLFKSNSDILQDVNKAFLRELRGTFTSIFNTGLTEALFPKGTGVSAGEAGRDDMYRGQQLQSIFGTNEKINEATTKLLGKQYGPMFAPLFNNLAQGYLEVGSRVAGKAIFQGIGDLGAKETMTLTGQVLGNYAAGNKKLAFEQLLYGASGGAKSGIALGPETLLAKYGFANPMEGISYFANALGEKATQPFAKMMGADDRSKSIVFEPRSGKYVNVDTGLYATQAEINAANVGYGSRVSQTPLLDPSINNFGVPGAPYQTTAGTGGNVTGGATNNYAYPGSGGGSSYRLVRDEESGKMVAPTRRQLLNLTPEQYAADIKGNDQKADIQIELAKQNADKQAKYHADLMRSAREREAVRLEAEQKFDEAAKVRSDAEIERNAYVTKHGSDSIVVAVEKAAGTGGSGTKPQGMQPGDGRKSGQLFDSNVYKDGKIVGSDPMREIGNFGFDMFKNALGGQLTQNIKNPYAQMVANFAIQKGLNYGVEAIMKSDFVTNMFSTGAEQLSGPVADTFVDTAANWVSSLFGFAGGGPVSGSGPAKLSNGEYVVDAKTAKENMGLLSLMNSLGLSGITDALGITGPAGQGHQVVSSSGVYNGFSMSKAADGTTVVAQPSYYDTGKSLTSFGKSVVDFGGILGNVVPGKNAVGYAAQFIGEMMTAPYDRQSDFWGDIDSGKSGAVSIGGGMFSMMDGSVKDSTGTTIGGTVVDGQGNPIGVGSGGTLGFGVGSNFSAMSAAMTSMQDAQIADTTASQSISGQNSAGTNSTDSFGSGEYARGGTVTGPGSGTSDSIPAMLSNGEFVVNAKAAKLYRPILDALNVKHLAEGTPAASGSVKDLSKALGTGETNSQLAMSNETLTSIDGSLRRISGRGTGSGTSVTGTGLSFDTGLGAFGGPAINRSASSVMGTATGGGGGRGRAPSTGDIVESLATSLAKGYLIRTGVGMAAQALFPGIAYEMTIANLAAGGGVSGFIAGAEAGASMVSAGIAEGLAVAGPYIPYILAAYVAYEIIDSIYGGGGGSSPPPKEPKFHAAMYVAGNNNPNAITPMYETLEYHAVPDVYKTIAYGLLRVAFNATKSAEAVTKITPPWDWLYMKVQFDKVSLIWGKGAPSRETLAADGYADNMSWPYSTELNLNSVASDIIDRITKEFKAGLAAENANLAKLDTAAVGLKNYSLDELSSGLISELKSGNLKLDSKVEKGIYASSVAESDRISSLINASAAKAAYITTATPDTYVGSGDGDSTLVPGTPGGINMVYSIKQGKFVKNPFGLDVILLDHGDRPVYNIEGTSAGLSIDDFVSAERAGTRTANILAPPVTAGSAGAAGATVVNAPSVVTTDASSLTNYYTTNQTTIDALRAAQTQTG